MNNTEFVFLYSTFPDTAAAEHVGRALIEAKLAACVNIHAPMTSLFEWDGKLEAATEVAVFIKTQAALVDAVIAVARPLHPYSVPCFLSVPIEDGNPEYLAWARRQTRAAT